MRESIINLENKLRGIHTRLKELHWSAPTIASHTMIDDFTSDFLEFEDSVMEDTQAIFNKIQPGELDPILSEATDFRGLLIELRGVLADFYEGLSGLTWTGIKSEIEGFWHVINKNIYLIGIDNEKI